MDANNQFEEANKDICQERARVNKEKALFEEEIKRIFYRRCILIQCFARAELI
tara:strand:+ start:769 stop:927 length:159 start_codon:yes stop_codon:yes gene_type:complete